MDYIYELCDKIINKKVLTIEALEMVLTGIAKGGRLRYRRKTDVFRSRAQSMNHRAKKCGVKGQVTPNQLKEIYEKNPQCSRCGATEDLTFDHIISFYRGGENSINNIQILCRKCNMEKGVN